MDKQFRQDIINQISQLNMTVQSLQKQIQEQPSAPSADMISSAILPDQLSVAQMEYLKKYNRYNELVTSRGNSMFIINNITELYDLAKELNKLDELEKDVVERMDIISSSSVNDSMTVQILNAVKYFDLPDKVIEKLLRNCNGVEQWYCPSILFHHFNWKLKREINQG